MTPRPPRDDEGMTLIEIVMAMVCMSIVMTLVTSAIIQIYHSVDGVDAFTEAQDQIDTAFVRLDQEIRYARSVSDPGQVSGDPYVEYLLDGDAVDTCVELRLHTATGELQRRQWTENQTPLAPTTWQTLAASVAGTTPFTVTPPDSTQLTSFRFQRLTLDVTSITGGAAAQRGGFGGRRQTTVTFTALNATAPDNASTCTEARGVAS